MRGVSEDVQRRHIANCAMRIPRTALASRVRSAWARKLLTPPNRGVAYGLTGKRSLTRVP